MDSRNVAILVVNLEDLRLKDCPTCEHYNHGKGKAMCLKCAKYDNFRTNFTKRSPIIFEHIPEAILSTIADKDERLPDLIMGVQSLPEDEALILISHYVSGLSKGQLGGLLKCSEATISRKLTSGKANLRKILFDK